MTFIKNLLLQLNLLQIECQDLNNIQMYCGNSTTVMANCHAARQMLKTIQLFIRLRMLVKII